MKPAWERLLVALLLAVQVALLAGVAARTSPAGDERTFYLYGHRILFEGSFYRDDDRMFNSKMPVQIIHVLPQFLAERVGLWPFTRLASGPVNPRQPHRAYLFWARLSGILLVPGFGLIFYLWARRLYGLWPALILLLWLALSPNLAAHLSLIVTDGLTVAVLFAALYFCRLYVLKPSAGRLVAAGVFLGLALLVKNSALLLAPIVILAWLLERWPRVWRRLKAGLFKEVASAGLRSSGVLIAWLAIALVVLNTGFGWQGFGASVESIGPESAAFRRLPDSLQSLPLPLPHEFLNGLDQVIFDDNNSETGGLIYFLGRGNHLGWAAYYPVALLLKLPLALLILLGLAIWLRWRGQDTPDDAWLMVPVVIILLNMCFRTTTHIGIKYVLPIVPLLLLFSGRVLAHRPSKWAFHQYLGKGVLVAWLVFSSLGHFPHYIPYFNELVDPRQAYQYLAKYDLDAGQAQDEALEWAKNQNPPVAVAPCPPPPGPVLVAANDLLGLHGQDCWRVLRESYQARECVAGAYFLFEVDDPSPRRWRLKPPDQP